MTEAVGERSLPIGALIAAAGGAVAAVGAVLPWESISILGVSESDSGLTSNPGKIIAILGAVAIGLALAWIMGVKVPAARAIAVVGALITLLAVVNFFTVSADVSNANTLFSGAASIGIGLFVDIAAGIVVIVGGALGLMNKAA
ncbi:MAG TPA: hypothetical protein VIK32_04940 [Candidatus Limnocylindrales bacterium]